MKRIGRNDPCPCGSGKKYKNCCLNKDQGANSKDFLWRKLRATHDQLATAVLKYGFDLYGVNLSENAWDDFILESDREYDPNSHENQLFIPWMLYSWLPEIENEIDSDFEDEDYQTIAESYLADHYHQLSAMERRFIEITINQPYSFYEIIDCDPGNGFRLKDLLVEREFDVIEKSGSQHALRGSVLFGQAIQYDNVGMLIATAPILISPGYKLDIINLRKTIHEHEESVETDDLILWEESIRALYFSIYDRMFTPPKLVNTDGDPLLFHEIYYDIHSPQAAFNKLKVLAIDTEEDELLSEAKFDKSGSLMEIEFPWLKRGNPKIASWENTVLGHILIKHNQLKISVNSEKRAKTINNRIKTLLKSDAVYKRTKVQSVESLIEKAEKKGMDSLTEPYPPELQEVLDNQMQEHWKQWLHQKIPALGNISPFQAVKDPDGREMVKALLDDLELKDRNVAPNQKQQKYIDWARQQLALA
ncbi:MAG: SEC-C domain-containing protein [bacterium]|nr:MAG: SEC-C domain-containing protein [bacterium]